MVSWEAVFDGGMGSREDWPARRRPRRPRRSRSPGRKGVGFSWEPVFDWDLLGEAAAGDFDDFLAEGEGFGAVVGDVKHGDAEFIADAGEAGEDAGFEGGVKAGERLVEEEELRGGEEGAGEGDALLFAAGKLGDAAVEEGIDFEDGGDVGQGEKVAGGRIAAAVKYILADGEVGEKGEVLGDVADAAEAGGGRRRGGRCLRGRGRRIQGGRKRGGGGRR